MPIVSESYSEPSRSVKIGQLPSSLLEVPVPGAISKSQIGWRSGPLSIEQERALEEKSSNWGNVRSRLDLYDQTYEYATKASRAFMVNDRDYSELRLAPALFRGKVAYRNDPERNYACALIPTSVTSGFLPPRLGDSAISSMAGGLLRRSVPTKSEINLTRFLGEQRDAPKLFRARAYAPRNPREVGGAYLNFLFGAKPTVEDLQRMAETVLQYDTVLRRYIRQERTRIRRKATITMAENSGNGTLPRVHGTFQSINAGPVRCTAHYLIPGSSSGFDNVVMVDSGWSWTARRTLSTFATFEYFVPKPADLERRLSRYRQMAQRVVGGGLNASTIYDLIRWTWLIDWFVDIGGLLRYQENVVDNQVVMSSSGYSLWEEFEWTCTISGWYRSPAPNSVGLWPTRYQSCTAATATVRHKTHRRRKGSPYSIAPTWNFSKQQWAILGALGLARSPNVPISNG